LVGNIYLRPVLSKIFLPVADDCQLLKLFYMSYYSRVYRHRNPNLQDENAKEPFFAKQNDTNNSGQRSAFFQAKLSVNQPGDKYEHEADSVANAVVNHKTHSPDVQQKKISTIQRLSTSTEDEKLGTKDARMARDKKIQKNPIQKMSADAEKEKKKGVQKMEGPLNEEKKKKKTSAVQAKQEASLNTAPASVSSKIENSSGEGNSLPKNTLHEMNSSFGVDFSNVKVHNDSDAIKMNKELQAQAFTHGRDIYFNEGKYHPESPAGKFLLAHELTHVVQQQESLQRKQIQRSFWGTVGGVLVGAGAGFLAGGPVGALIGGVAGGVGGDAATTSTRGLNKDETSEAQRVFGNSLDYNLVRVSDSSELLQIGGYARTPGNTVFFPTGTLGRSDPSYYAFLIHELTHTWQTQHGVSVLTKVRYSLSESNYDFGEDAGLAKAIQDGKCFNAFNTEAQASILEQYYKILTGLAKGDLSIYEYFIFQVQVLKGTCRAQAPGIKTDILDPKYRGNGAENKSVA
jgi:hypothetical protein